MCTALMHRTAGGFLARNLDLQEVYGQQVAVLPRCAPLHFRHQPSLRTHYAMLGAAVVRDGMPLFFEAVNEKGLCAAALAFEGECVYAPPCQTAGELAPFELIPFVLAQCASVEEARRLLKTVRLTAIPFAAEEPLTPLHWIVADRERSLAVEPLSDGLHLTEDPVEVMTNSPRMSYQLTHLAEYANLHVEEPRHALSLTPFHRGFGLKGLPGDFTPTSRFVKAAFLKEALPQTADVTAGMLDSFRVLDSVAYLHGTMPKGEAFAVTQYSCVCHLPSGTYYYKTYADPTVRAVSLSRVSLEGTLCKVYPMTNAFRVTEEN